MRWARRFQALSLRRQLRTTLALVSVLALLVAGGCLLTLEARRAELALADELRATASLVANRSSAALAFADETGANENLRALQYLETIGQACLVDTSGRPMAIYACSGLEQACPSDAGVQNAMNVLNEHVTAVMAGQSVVGRLWLRASPDTIAKRLKPTLWSLGVALALALVAALLVSMPLQRLISVPMERIRHVAVRVEESGDFSLRAPIVGGNELGRLGSAFNRMLDTIAAQNSSLAAREQYARTLFSSSHLAQLVIERADGVIHDANPAAAVLLGEHGTVPLLGRHLSDFLAPEQAWATHFLAALAPEVTAELSLRFHRPDSKTQAGTQWDGVARFLLVDLQGQERVHCSLEDVTQRLADEKAIRQANEELELRVARRTRDLAESVERLKETRDQLVEVEKQVALGRLVAGMAHEVNTPVGNARLAVSTLQDAIKEFEVRSASGLRRSDLQQMLSRITEGSELAERNLSRVVDLVGTFKHVSADQASSQARTFQLDTLVNEVLQVMAPQMRRSPCTLELALEPGLEMHSHAGPIEQVLVNLIQNALMHGLESSGEAGRLRIEARRLSPGWLQMAVQDNGRGIDPEHLPRIFDPFFTTKLGRGGLGLGLVIVQSLARQLLGGQLRVHSKLGEGTRFELDMPEQAPSQPLNSQSAPL